MFASRSLMDGRAIRKISTSAIMILFTLLSFHAFSRGGTIEGQLQPEEHYRRVCYETSVEHIGYTCEATGPCSSRAYSCLDKYELYRHTYTCQLVDSWGNVYRTWTETEETEKHNGCCNICVMRHGQALQLDAQLVACSL